MNCKSHQVGISNCICDISIDICTTQLVLPDRRQWIHTYVDFERMIKSEVWIDCCLINAPHARVEYVTSHTTFGGIYYCMVCSTVPQDRIQILININTTPVNMRAFMSEVTKATYLRSRNPIRPHTRAINKVNPIIT